MKLYRTLEKDGTPVAQAGWSGTQADAKADAKAIGGSFRDEEVPVDKPGLLKWLNARFISETFPAPQQMDGRPVLDELEQAELRAVNGGTTAPTYQSPLDARTVIAGIDANMIAAAIAQFDGPNLAKVVHASILRMAQLGKGLNALGETSDGG